MNLKHPMVVDTLAQGYRTFVCENLPDGNMFEGPWRR